MATITATKVCASCAFDLTDIPGIYCPNCARPHSRSKKAAGEFFEAPYYVLFQQRDHKAALDSEKTKIGEAAYSTRLLEIDDTMHKYLRETEVEDLLAPLFDAHLVMSEILNSRAEGQDLLKAVTTSKAIGKLGEAIEQYVKAGGQAANVRGQTGSLYPSAGLPAPSPATITHSRSVLGRNPS
jgi:hypothetical protein